MDLSERDLLYRSLLAGDLTDLNPVRLLRRRKRVSIAALAEAVGCAYATVHNLERGITRRPSISILRRIARSLDVLPSRLLNDLSEWWELLEVQESDKPIPREDLLMRLLNFEQEEARRLAHEQRVLYEDGHDHRPAPK